MTGAGGGAAPAVAVSGHRGACGVPGVPENTLAAFRYAARAGAAAVELDVRWTRDQQMVVLHDATLDRTTEGCGPVELLTLAALRRQVPAAALPTFAEVLACAHEHGLAVNPEVKPVPGHPLTDDQARAYVEEVAAHAMTERTVVSSTSPAVLQRVRRQPGARGLRSALITGRRGAVPPAVARSLGTVYMPDHRTLTPASVEAHHRAGTEIWAWPAITPDDVSAMVALGVDVVVADDPAVATAVLAR